MNKSNSLLGPWVIMATLPWLFPIVLIFMLIAAAIKGSIEPLRTVHITGFFLASLALLCMLGSIS